ncbi:ABC transporter ATP-binding protein [soil metagenome]
MSAELTFADVSYHHRGNKAPTVHDVSLRIGAGEMVALLGASGSGKSTLLRLAAGLAEPSAGGVLIGGVDQRGMSARRRGIAMVFQKPLLFPHLSVIDNVAFADRIAGQTKAEARRAAAEYLDLVQVSDLAQRRSRELSGGQEQRVAVAGALAARPSILLLDEPLGGLDTAVRESLYEVLAQIRRQLAPTIVLVTHDLSESSLADRVAILGGGSIEAQGELAALYARPTNVQVARLLGGFTEICGQVRSGIHHNPAGKVSLPSGCDLPDGPGVLLLHRQGLQVELTSELAPASGPQMPEVDPCVDSALTGQITDVRAAGLRQRLTIALPGSGDSVRTASVEADVAGGPHWAGVSPGRHVRIRANVPGVWAVPTTSTLRP